MCVVVKKTFSAILANLVLCFSVSVFSVSADYWTDTEKTLVDNICEQLEFALDQDCFSTYDYADEDDRLIRLSLVQYPQLLTGSKHRSNLPQEALDKFNAEIYYSSDEGERLVDCSQSLRLQAHASRSPKPLCPFLIKVRISGWHDLHTLHFLQHPLLKNNKLFVACLYSLDVVDSGIQNFNCSYLNGYSILTELDLHGNQIAELILGESFLSFLEKLILADNSIRDLGSFFTAGWWRLQALDVSNNAISALGENVFKSLIMLYDLCLEQNLLGNSRIHACAFDGVSEATPHFRLVVNLSDNTLTDFPQIQAVAPKLIRLNLDHNPITEVDSELLDFAQFRMLREVSLLNNARTSAQNASLKEQLRNLLDCRIVVDARPVDNSGYTTP